ncbi:unnamed protein product, partial [Echinostoma caproni]|uniref:HCO3_cotransp domain-containing protein n=1 Tax=Echinostoma caproni TaxID=27848 RepID=A0A183A7M1_9TREM
CATSPCHRREEDNNVAVEEFKRELWARKEFLCYARPSKQSTPIALPPDILDYSAESYASLTETQSSSLSDPVEQVDNNDEVSEEAEDADLLDDGLTDETTTTFAATTKTTTASVGIQSNKQIQSRSRDKKLLLASLFSPLSRDPQDAAAILHRLYSSAMFWHSLCWPGGIFFGSLLLLLFTYLADGCEAWASDKTVIA